MIRDLEGKVILVTGATAGLGRFAALALADRGADVVVHGRSEGRVAPVVAEITARGGVARPLIGDFTSLSATRDAARRFLDSGSPLDVLVNNAGIAGTNGASPNGFEMTFAVNHLAPFLFTAWLVPRLQERGGARIVNVASRAHTRVDGLDFDELRRPGSGWVAFPRYCRTKLCNVLFTKELARGRAPGVHSYALHPGVVASEFWRTWPWPLPPLMRLATVSVEEGARTQLWCATSPDVADHDGRYYADAREVPCSPAAGDPELARRLWVTSEEMVAPFAPDRTVA